MQREQRCWARALFPLGVTTSQAQANLYAWLPYSSSTTVLNGPQIAPLFQDSSNARWTKEPLSEWVRPSELITRVTFKSLSPLQISGEILLESIFYTQPDGGPRKKKGNEGTNERVSERMNAWASERIARFFVKNALIKGIHQSRWRWAGF